MRKRERNSSLKAKARKLFEESNKPIREIARTIKVDDKTLRNWISAGEWSRGSANIPQPVRIGDAAARVVERIDEVLVADDPHPVAPPRAASEIARDFCGTMDVLRAEIDAVVRNLHLVREIAEANLDDPEAKTSAARRKLIDKVLELPGLVKASNDLTAALSRLADAGPGKKEEAKDRAIAAGTGRFATPQAPKHSADTLQ